MEAGQHSEAEEWLSHLVTAQPDNAEARELFGYLLEAKGDTAGAALQYSRALELLLADPDNSENETQPASLYAKVKELAPASPLVAKWASTFSPKPPASVPAVETPVSAEPTDGIDPETHYTLGVAYKNMGLLDEAKDEFRSLDEGSRLFPGLLSHDRGLFERTGRRPVRQCTTRAAVEGSEVPGGQGSGHSL